MPGAGRTVIGNFLWLGLGELGARFIGFGVLVYLARALGADHYGIVGFAFAVVLYFTTAADFGIETLGPREVVAHRGDLERFGSSLLSARVILGAVFSAALALVALLAFPQPDAAVLALYGLLLLPVGGSSRWIHLGLERTGSIAISRIAGELLRAGLIVGLVRTPADLLYAPVAHILGETLTTTVLAVSLRRRGIRLRPRWDMATVLTVFRSAWPVVISITMGMVLYNSDVLLLRLFRPGPEVGYYVAAYTLLTLLGNLGTSYSNTLLPTLARLGIATERGSALYRTAIAQVILAGLPIAVGGFLLAPRLIAFFFGAAYQPSARVLQVLLLTTPLLLVRLVQHAALFVCGRQARVMWATTIAALVNIGANLVVIPRYGMVGAASTTLFAEGMRTALIQLHILHEGVAVAVGRAIWRPAVATAAMAFLLLAAPVESVWLSLLLGAAAYAVAFILVGGLELQAGRAPGLRL